MKHLSITLLLAAAALLAPAATSCGKTGNTTSTEQQATTAQEQDFNDEAVQAITDFYTTTVLNDRADATPAIEQLCTERMKSKLSQAYDSEYADGGGYAVWELRSGAQDGDGSSHIDGVTPQGNGWFLVSFTDMGLTGTKLIKVVRQDGRILLDDYK